MTSLNATHLDVLPQREPGLAVARALSELLRGEHYLLMRRPMSLITESGEN